MGASANWKLTEKKAGKIQRGRPSKEKTLFEDAKIGPENR
jgi:hypothetical protein